MADDFSKSVKRLANAQQTVAGNRRRPATRPPYPTRENPTKSILPPVGRAPARPKAAPQKPGLSLAQMLAATTRYFPTRIENAARDSVTVTSMRKKGVTLEFETLTYNGTKSVPEIRKHKQLVRKRLTRDGDPNAMLPFANAKLHVSCACEDHLYTFEYALAERDAAKITYSNAEFPIMKNPNLVPGLCKHLYVVAQKILQKRV